jgi:hypothetical protein
VEDDGAVRDLIQEQPITGTTADVQGAQTGHVCHMRVVVLGRRNGFLIGIQHDQQRGG